MYNWPDEGIFQPKITIMSTFTHPHVVPNLHDKRNIEKYLNPHNESQWGPKWFWTFFIYTDQNIFFCDPLKKESPTGLHRDIRIYIFKSNVLDASQSISHEKAKSLTKSIHDAVYSKSFLTHSKERHNIVLLSVIMHMNN